MKEPVFSSRFLVPTWQPRALLQSVYLRVAIVVFCARTQETASYYYLRGGTHALQGYVWGSQQGFANCLGRLASHVGCEIRHSTVFTVLVPEFKTNSLRLRNSVRGGPSSAIISAYRMAWSDSVSRLRVSNKCPFSNSVHACSGSEVRKR
jgi:hypothetical protein